MGMNEKPNIANLEPTDSTSLTSNKTGWVRSLSGKLLLLTAIFVMLAEILIFVPSIANFRNVWLRTHLDNAEAASIIFLDFSDVMLSEEASAELLVVTQSIAGAVRQQGEQSMMIATKDQPMDVTEHIDLDNATVLGSITSSLGMLFSEPSRQYRVFGAMRSRDAVIELVQETKHIQHAMYVYSRNVLILSLLISIITAGLVYLALYRVIVRPIVRISSNMEAFSKSPENVSLIFKPSNRKDELGIAEERLSAFQSDLQNTLRQKERLAALGLAVSKINHDLRNILASAQLFSDRLTSLPDPTVQRFAPKLIRTIDRAVDYTKSVIDYGKAMEAPPKRRRLLLGKIVADVAELLGMENHTRIKWRDEIPDGFEADADPEQLFRILLNLCRNAEQAMSDLDEEEAKDRDFILGVSAEKADATTIIRVFDTGPGIPEHVREKLFLAFQGSTKSGGSGLGLTIAAELVRAHGGMIYIEKTGQNGTVFKLEIPEPVVELPDSIMNLS